MKYLYLYLLFIPTLFFVYYYNKISFSEQILNKKIIWNICGWNILHVIAFFLICCFCKPTTIDDYLEIILFMIVWYLIEFATFYLNNKYKLVKINKKVIRKTNKMIYSNPYVPRVDDFIFNFSGILIYIFLKKVYLL
tara:strand:+ start:596 stop:1006 length:411 start_codon:yes stop_codon:yes gene_type:complete